MSYNPEIGRPAVTSRQSQQQVDRGYAYSSEGMDEHTANGRHPVSGIAANDFSPVAQTNSVQQYGKFHEDWDASQRGSSIIDGDRSYSHRAPSVMSHSDQQVLPKRGGTLKKKASLRRSGSRRSSRAGSVRSLALQPEPTDQLHSAFYTPVPTTGNPTEHLANRFTGKNALSVAEFCGPTNSLQQHGANS